MRKHYHGYYDSQGRECNKCKVYKLYEYYHKHSGCVNGYNTVCKDCRKPLSKQNYARMTLEYKMWHRCKTRARSKGIDFNLEESDFILPERCPIFNTEWEIGNHDLTPSVDRIDPSKGYIKGNIQIISNRANMLKGNASIEDIERLLTYMKRNNCEL